MRFFALLGLVLAGLAWAESNEDRLLQVGIDAYAKAAIFDFGELKYTFALNVVENGDVYYHINAPSYFSWMGVGFGDSMTGTRMLIAYIGENGHNITNSCRLSYGHSEPVWDPDCKIDGVWHDIYGPFANTMSPTGDLIAHSVCRGCATWPGGSLDLNNTRQNFIFALGPNKTIASDDPAANIRMHEIHGTFQLDMTVATNYSGDYGRIPAPADPTVHGLNKAGVFANYYSYNPSVTFDTNWAPTLHGVIMVLAFVLVFPVGALSLRLFKRVFIHAALQFVGSIFVLAGFSIAMYLSKLYTKSQNYNSAHQIIGMLIFAALFLQIGLGIVHHCLFVRQKSPSVMGKVHRIMGISIVGLALVNAGVGFDFAQNSNDNIPYGIVVAFFGLAILLLLGYIFLSSRRAAAFQAQNGMSAPGVYLPDKYGSEFPAEYEMHNAPFAKMGAVQTPRTPFFGQTKYDEEDPEDYRSYVQQQKSYTDAEE